MIVKQAASAQAWDGSKVLFLENNRELAYNPEQIFRLDFFGVEYIRAYFDEDRGCYNINGNPYFGDKLQCLKKALQYIDKIDLNTCRWKYGAHNSKYCEAYIFRDKCLGCVYADFSYVLCNGTQGKFESWKEAVDGIEPLLDTLRGQIKNIIAAQREELCGMIKGMEDTNTSTE